GGSSRDLSIVQFPLCDLDNNVVALIGFSKKSEMHKVSPLELLNLNIYKELPVALAIVDRELRVIAASSLLTKLIAGSSNQNLIGKEVSGLFDKKFVSILEEYLKNDKKEEPLIFNYIFMEKQNLNAEIRLEKISDDDLGYTGMQILITKKVERDSESEVKSKMYDAIIQHSPVAMFIYDIENLKFMEVNDVALKLYGYKRSDFLNMDLTDLYAPEDIQTIIESGDSKSVEGSFSGPWRHKKSDGSSVLVELNRTLIDFNGKKSHLNIVQNVSEQAEIKRRIQVFESAYENTSDPIISTDKDGFIIDINDQVTKRLGYSRKDLETRPFITLVSDEDRAKVNKSVFHSGLLKTVSLDVAFKKSSGTLQAATTVATPIKNYNGEIESFCLIIKLVEESVNTGDTNSSQVELVQKIDPPFLSNIFHEILTPINVIMGFTQELGESIPAPNTEQKEAIDIIKENQKLLLQIMDNAVEYSTLEQKVIKFRPEEFKFVEIIEELKENTRKAAEDKNVAIDYGMISSTLALTTDKSKLSSLISLFMKFAIQLTKESSVHIAASVYNSDYFAVKIKDTPNMISPYLLKAFAEIFAADENISRRNYGFSRFSVKLAKKLIDLLDVRKETIFKDGEPVEFALIFPLKFVAGDKEKMEVESVNTQKKAEIKISPKPSVKVHSEIKNAENGMEREEKVPDLSQLSCLYLEDQLDSQMLFKVQFKDLKSIEFAQSFENALPLLKTKKFDFIVMDINLQGEYNGLDAMRIIQKMPGFKDLPIIASTAYVQPGARDNFIAAGFTEFVSKPLLREKLLEVLKNLF
ncbi:MAG: PAS domain S-box protein, partial [Melioribacteraceae bacterium]